MRGGDTVTYLEILSWARKGLAAEKTKLREMQDKAIEGGARQLMEKAQELIDDIEVKEATLDEIEELHNRK